MKEEFKLEWKVLRRDGQVSSVYYYINHELLVIFEYDFNDCSVLYPQNYPSRVAERDKRDVLDYINTKHLDTLIEGKYE